MLASIFEFIIESLSLVLDFFSLKDSKKDTSQKKRTSIKNISLFLVVIASTIIILFSFDKINFGNEKRAFEKLVAIEKILNSEKEDIGTYPTKLSDIVRNNPLRKDILIDIWGNAYHYEQLKNGQNYKLSSKGKDGILNTKDDIDTN